MLFIFVNSEAERRVLSDHRWSSHALGKRLRARDGLKRTLMFSMLGKYSDHRALVSMFTTPPTSRRRRAGEGGAEEHYGEHENPVELKQRVRRGDVICREAEQRRWRAAFRGVGGVEE